MKVPFQIEIPRRSAFCAKGQEQFAAGSEYYSALMEGANGEWQRQDFCLSCWEGPVCQDYIRNAKSFWKSKVPLKQETEALSRNREERALQLLKQALKEGHHEEAFVLALFLARSRMIVLREQLPQDDGSLLNLYEVTSTEEMLAVKKITLPQLKINEIQQQLANKMSAER